MSGPGFTRPISVRYTLPPSRKSSPKQVRGGLSADGYPLAAMTRSEARGSDCRTPAGGGRTMTDRGRHRPRHPPVHGGSRARRGGHRGVCLLLARLRGRPGPRRERDHRPAGADHHRRPRLRLQHGRPARRTAPGTGPLAGSLAARAGHRGHPHGEHGPGLVTRPHRSSSRGLASSQPRRLL